MAAASSILPALRAPCGAGHPARQERAGPGTDAPGGGAAALCAAAQSSRQAQPERPGCQVRPGGLCIAFDWSPALGQPPAQQQAVAVSGNVCLGADMSGVYWGMQCKHHVASFGGSKCRMALMDCPLDWAQVEPEPPVVHRVSNMLQHAA